MREPLYLPTALILQVSEAQRPKTCFKVQSYLVAELGFEPRA